MNYNTVVLYFSILLHCYITRPLVSVSNATNFYFKM
jgi:hypothetical protein